jgi:hypothetical protein
MERREIEALHREVLRGQEEQEEMEYQEEQEVLQVMREQEAARQMRLHPPFSCCKCIIESIFIGKLHVAVLQVRYFICQPETQALSAVCRPSAVGLSSSLATWQGEPCHIAM